MGIDFKKVFGDIGKVALDVLKKTVIQFGSKIPEVQDAIDEQKKLAGQRMLWAIFPILLIGIVLVFLMRGK